MTTWRKASASGGTSCVEVAVNGAGALVRDSKDPDGPVLTISAGAWRALLEDIRHEP